jgi:hypothetical protein
LLTIEEHAEAHRLLYEQYGRWQDRVAWHGLEKRISKQEAERQAHLEGVASFRKSENAKRRDAKASASLREKYTHQPHWKIGLSKETDARVANAAAGVRGWYEAGGNVWNKGKKCPSLSAATKLQAKTKNFHCIGDYQRGRTFDDTHKQKLTERALNREKKTCLHCGKICQPAMFARWHGDKCRMKTDK